MTDTLHTCVVCGKAQPTQPTHAFHKAQLNGRKRKPWCKTCCRDYQLQKKFGLSRAEYDEMLGQQGGRCAICGSLDPGTNAKGQFCVDHDHVTGELRGLLCNRCNTGLGAFKDNPQALLKAVAYLEDAMKFTARLANPRINVDRYRTALDRHMKEVLAQGLMEWLHTALLEIPNWSGASRATFWRLAETINAQVDASGPRVGIGQLAGDGSIETDKMKGVYAFTYSTTLPWLVWNEWHDANVDPDPTKYPPPARLKKPGPYHFQAQAALAFMRFADTVRLPKVAPYAKSYPVK